ncbi:DMT family transporter [Candidatus Kaiserbacteria bacterium]|nr:DMT family transporter [Candidatus Kaiserbacteria bacterium]
MTWQMLAIGAPLLFVIYQSVSKLLPSDISPFLVNAYASAVGAIVMLVLYLLTSTSKTLVLGSKTIWLAIAIGTLISLGNVAIIKAYGLGAPQSSFSSIFYPLLIAYALVVGLFFWNERLNWYQILGVVLSIIGVLLVLYFKR